MAASPGFPARFHRLLKEIAELLNNPPEHVVCLKPASITQLEEWARTRDAALKCVLNGAPETPHEGARYEVDIILPDRYPIVPPVPRFLSYIYHPNIDSNGKVCLDLLKTPPTGNWSPAVSIASLLTSLLALLSHPNPEDPLCPDIAAEYKYRYHVYCEKVKANVAQSRALEYNKDAKRVLALDENDDVNRSQWLAKKRRAT